jgi:hypothetical protein
VKQRDRRRNRYDIQHGLPLREATSRERTIGDVLDVLSPCPSGTEAADQGAGRRSEIRAPSPTPRATRVRPNAHIQLDSQDRSRVRRSHHEGTLR